MEYYRFSIFFTFLIISLMMIGFFTEKRSKLA
jgi:hypothetical protein